MKYNFKILKKRLLFLLELDFKVHAVTIASIHAAYGTSDIFDSIAPPSGIVLVNHLGFDVLVRVIDACI